MGKIFQPQTSIKLTNVSVVKLKYKGKKFEIACYKNKIIEYRNKIETDLGNVLQINQIFTNVSKGQVSSAKDLQVFEGMGQDKIIEMILLKGEIQMNQLERQQQLQNLTRDTLHIIVEKTLNPATQKPYTIGIIEKVTKELHFNPNPTKNAKQQALEWIQKIQDSGLIEIQRVPLQVRIEWKEVVEIPFFSVTKSSATESIGTIDPSKLKELQEFVGQKGTVQII
jgi:ribosome maturation protein SDO1